MKVEGGANSDSAYRHLQSKHHRRTAASINIRPSLQARSVPSNRSPISFIHHGRLSCGTHAPEGRSLGGTGQPPEVSCTVDEWKSSRYGHAVYSRSGPDSDVGLQKVDVGPPHPSTAQRAQGYDMGLVAILDKPEDLAVYAAHPVHQE
jgi:hypothetical protein